MEIGRDLGHDLDGGLGIVGRFLGESGSGENEEGGSGPPSAWISWLETLLDVAVQGAGPRTPTGSSRRMRRRTQLNIGAMVPDLRQINMKTRHQLPIF
jgi:hypothetical protein